MSPIERAAQRLDAYRRHVQVSLLAVLAVAVLVAFADGFWLTSLQGAVGSIGRSDAPFERWLRDSLLMVPVFAVAVLVGLRLARRWLPHDRRPVVRFVGAVALVVLVCTAAGVGRTVVSSVLDYRTQSAHLAVVHGHHPQTVVDPSTIPAGGLVITCDALCLSRKATVAAHVRGVALTSGWLLVTNLVLVLWVVALRGGRLWDPSGGTAAAGDDEPAVRVTPGPMEGALV